MGFADNAKSSLANNARLRARFRKSIFEDADTTSSPTPSGKKRKLSPKAELRVAKQQKRNFRQQLLLILVLLLIALMLTLYLS